MPQRPGQTSPIIDKAARPSGLSGRDSSMGIWK
jgi:hypothetical protein